MDLLIFLDLRPSLLAALLAIPCAACWPSDLDESGKQCSSERQCSEGYLCLAARCAPRNETVDGSVQLVPSGSLWRFRYDGNAPPSGWERPGWDDAHWTEGRAPLGFGQSFEGTVIWTELRGPTTAYFRLRFDVPDPALYREPKVSIQRDDGALVRLNGSEVCRSNMPAGPVGNETFASGHVGAPEETTYFDCPFGAALLRVGENVLAVEVHQYAVESADLRFDLGLEATGPRAR